MSLYWCVFDGPLEIDGIDAGSYADFASLRDAIAGRLEQGRPGSRFPTLMRHSDCEGEWPAGDCERLEAELAAIIEAFGKEPPLPAEIGARGDWGPPRNALECFRDADGELLLLRLRRMAAHARRRGLPILFQ